MVTSAGWENACNMFIYSIMSPWYEPDCIDMKDDHYLNRERSSYIDIDMKFM